MKKNLKILIITLLSLVVLIGALVVVLNLPPNEELTENSSGNGILIFDKTNIYAEEITVSNKSGEYTVMGYNYSDNSQDTSDENSKTELSMVYTMQEYEEQLLSKTMTDSLAEQCCYMAALKVVDKSGERDSEYGLDKPSATVSVIYSDNSQETMYIGNYAPDNKGLYFKSARSKNVYLVQNNMVNMFLVDKLQMFNKELSPALDSDYSITDVKISGTFDDNDIIIKTSDNIANFCNFVMEKPYREICDNTFTENFGKSIYGMNGTTVIAVDVTKEDIKKYRLDNPYMDIEVKASNDVKSHIILSEKDKDNNCYIMSVNGTRIYQMSTEELECYGVKYRDFFASSVIVPNMHNLVEVDIFANNKNYHYDITHKIKINEVYEEVIENEITYNGKQISYTNMSIFANNVAGISRIGSVPNSIEGCEEIFSIKYSFEKEETKMSDTMKLYKTSDNQIIIVLNDVIEGYTDSKYVQSVIEQTEKIFNDKMLEKLNNKDEIEVSESSEQSNG